SRNRRRGGGRHPGAGASALPRRSGIARVSPGKPLGPMKTCHKEKGAARGCKRPKSREETPKEGSGNARRYRTAARCHRTAQNARAIDLFSWPKGHPIFCIRPSETFRESRILTIFQMVVRRAPWSAACLGASAQSVGGA